MNITKITRKEYVAKVKLENELRDIGIPDAIITKMQGDGFKALIDFLGLTAERLMAQYDGLKFGIAHRLSIAALTAARDEAKRLNEEGGG